MITSRTNSRLKDIRRARRCKDEKAVLEGPHLVLEALNAGLTLDTVLATESFLAKEPGRDLLARLPRQPLLVEPRLLNDLTDSDSPRGILALVDLPRGGVSDLPVAPEGVYLYLDGVQDPGNLGALARVAEASGVTALCAGPGTAHPNHPRALRASAGSLLRLPIASQVQASELDHHLRQVSPTWLALRTRGGQDLYQPLPTGCLIVAIGAEKGLSEELVERADLGLTIDLAAPVESLNTTVAAALVLFELKRQRS